MKKVMTWLTNIRPLKILTVFLAATFLLITQACSGPGIAQEPVQTNPTQSYELNTPKGGMNNSSSVDPGAKADQRAANAPSNFEQKGIDDSTLMSSNYQKGKPLDEQIKQLGEDIKDSATELGEGLTKKTERGVENLQKNTERTAKDLTKNVKRGAEDTKDGLQRQAKDAADAVKQTIRQVD
ncbi:hypothetical protein VB620_16125 [Nodularia harveyana UHCC-0300]|uniref:Uncharacterized protein n=1 Tax=Nodularia harveyana UHCC-0300 TaxID=2974287 RepID=A0ABU5UH19_9CYAN|nr:hypothetical protein [Nodularia harveyana]MEA5582863.1 hypothetical protein [Nodularia harveyana UHCC-0300]